MRRRSIIILILLLLAVLAAVWYSLAAEFLGKPSGEIPAFKLLPSRKVNSLSLVADIYSPFVVARYVNGEEQDEDPNGFCAEVVRAVLKRMGVSIRSNSIYPWPRALHLVKIGRKDAIYGAVKSPERAKYFNYPKEFLCYYNPKIVVEAKLAKTLRYRSFDELKHLRFGAIRDGYYPDEFWKMARKYNNLSFVSHMDSLYRFMQKGRINAMIMSEDELRSLEKKYDEVGKYAPIEGEFLNEKLYLAFSKQSVNKEMVERFSKALGEFKQTQEFRDLCKKYNLLDAIPKPQKAAPAK